MILDQFGREIKITKAPEKRPLAAAPVLDSWREYVCAGLTPQRLTALLREADAGDVRRQAELFDQMEEKDAHLLGEAAKRRNAILDIEFKVSPATEDGRDVKVAKFVQEYFDNMTDWDDTLVALQDSVGKGFSALEIQWDVSTGQAMPNDLDFIEQKRFLFTDQAGYLRKYPRLISDDDSMGTEIPAWKILFHRYGGKAGHAARSGIYRVCTWMYLFRNYSLKDWMGFIEVFGMPLRLGKYDSGASQEDKDALITAIQNLGSDAAGIISKGTEIEFIEAIKGSGKSDNPYLALAGFCAKEISKALLGQTLSAEVGDSGSYAASKTHNEVRLDLAKADTRAVGASVRYQIIRPMVGFNFGWDTPCPGYKAIWNEREDLQSLSETYKNVAALGQPIAAEHVSERFGIPLPEKGQTILQPQSPGIAMKDSDLNVAGLLGPDAGPYMPVAGKVATGAEFNARLKAPEDPDSPADTLNALGAKVLDAADFDGLTGVIEKALNDAATLEEFRDRLLDLYTEMDEAALGELMARGLTLAELSGRFDAEER